MNKYYLRVVPEANDENDNPTCWSVHVFDNHFIWICKYSNNEYRIENSNGYCLNDKTYKTLSGAVRIARQIAERQNESGFTTD